ncbi:MAG TPA: hypothetical protein VM841_15505 [Actinomycetota bacterium]|nr:hypothetical protein [Actinomycetota bacterium]
MDILIVLVLAAFLAVLMTRGILTRPGLIQYSADFSIHAEIAQELGHWRGAWNPFLGDDNSAVISQAPPFLLLVPLVGTEWAQKLLLLGVYFLMAAAAGLTAYSWIRSLAPRRALILAVSAAIVYTVNPWVSVESVHLYYLLLYALLPLTVHWTRAALTSETNSGAFRGSVGAGLIVAATLTAYGILFHSMLVGILGLSFLASGPAKFRDRAKLILVGASGYSLGLIIASMYWILPVILGFRAGFSSGTSWALFTTKDLFVLSPFTPLWLNIAGFYRDTTSFLINTAAGADVASIALVGGYGLLLGVVLFFVVRSTRRRWAEGGLVFSVFFFAWLAKGTGFPRGDAYAALAAAPGLRRIAFILFKGPYKLIPLTVFCLVTLSILALAAIDLRSVAGRVGAVVMSGSIVVWSMVGGLPLLTGDLAGYMAPVSMPEQFRQSLVRSGLGDSKTPGRAVWLPFQRDGNVPPSWIDRRAEIPLISGAAAPLPGWVSPANVSSRGVSWLGPAQGRTLDLIVSELIDGESPDDLGRFLSANGRSAVVVRLDFPGGRETGEKLARRTDFRQRYADDLLAVYEPRSLSTLPARSEGVTVVVGGIRQIAAESARSEGPLRRPYVLSAHLPEESRSLSWWRAVRQVTFAPGRGWLDLALDSPSDSVTHLSAADLVHQTVPLSEWDKDFFESNTWLPSRLRGMQGRLQDPSLSSNFLVTSANAHLTVPIERAEPCSCQIWVRAFVGPRGGSVIASTNSGESVTHSMLDEISAGWRWLRGPKVELSPNRHHVEIAFVGGFNAVDVVAVAPVGAAEARAEQLRDALSRTDIVVDSGAAIREGVPVALESIASVIAQSGEVAERRSPGRIALTGRAHPSSGLWSAVLKPATPITVRGMRGLRLHMSLPEVGDASEIEIAASDGATAPARASFSMSPGDRVFHVDLGGRPEPAERDFAIDSIVLNIRARPGASVAADLSGIEMIPGGMGSKESVRQVSLPERGRYRVAIRSRVAGNTKAKIASSDLELRRFENSGWLVSDHIELSQGETSLALPAALDGEATALLYLSRTESRDAFGDAGTLPQGGARIVERIPEPYSPHWVAKTGNRTIEPFRVNGFSTAFIYNDDAPIAVSFAPDRWILPGRLSTLLGLLMLAGYAVRTRSSRKDLHVG